MKKVLITGIGGFVGKHLAQHLLSQSDYEVSGTYRSVSSREGLADLKDTVSLKQLDLTDAEQVQGLIQEQKVDCIVHLAAQASASVSLKNPHETLTTNIAVQSNILEALKAGNFQSTRLLVISTGEIYGLVKPGDVPIDEETPMRPVSPYAVSKIAQDYLAYQYFLAYKQDVVRLRPYNHIGPGQKTGFVVADFAKQIAEIEKGDKEPVMTVGNLDAKRDFTDVRDMVRAYQLAIEKGISGEAYNIGSGTSVRVGDILEMLISYANKKVEIKKDPALFRPIEVPEIVCDNTKFSQLTGWKPEIPFETTLKETLDYWRKIV